MQHLKFDFKFEKCSDGGNKRPERSTGGGKKKITPGGTFSKFLD